MHELRWDGRTTRVSLCPVCGGPGSKRRILELVPRGPGPEPGGTALLQCPDCEARYAEPLRAARYEEVDRHGLKFYLEQGAGIRTMLEPLSLIDARPIRRYLEIGCSFGFVLDYARRVLGWEVRGFDPGFIAAAGARQLRLPIENTYFTGLAPGEMQADLLFCSEVIEHVVEPNAFLGLLRNALDQHGLLLLTTPNGDALSPNLAPELLLPLLSPGQHAILYGRKAITVLLRQAGFEHIRIDDSSHQLRVAASTVPFAGTSSHFSADLYRRYLLEVAAEHDPAEPLGAGLACRLLKEEIAASRYADAEPCYRRLREGYLRRYDLDIEEIDLDAMPSAATADFSALAEGWPCNLAGLWHSRGVLKLLRDDDPRAAAGFFAAAVRFGSALRSRFQAIGGDDAETALFCREAEIAHLHCLARSDPEQAAASFEILERRSGGPEGADFPVHAARARRLLFGDLVRAGHYALAERVLGQGGLPVSSGEDFEGVSLDLACGLYLLNHAADYPRAAALLDRLHETMSRSLVSGAADDAKQQLFWELEIAWLMALARSEARRVPGAYEEISDNRGRSDASAFAAHRQRAFRQALGDLVNLGRYDVARQMLLGRPEEEDMLAEMPDEFRARLQALSTPTAEARAHGRLLNWIKGFRYS